MYFPVFMIRPLVLCDINSIINFLSQSLSSEEVTPVVIMSSPPFKKVEVVISSEICLEEQVVREIQMAL